MDSCSRFKWPAFHSKMAAACTITSSLDAVTSSLALIEQRNLPSEGNAARKEREKVKLNSSSTIYVFSETSTLPSRQYLDHVYLTSIPIKEKSKKEETISHHYKPTFSPSPFFQEDTLAHFSLYCPGSLSPHTHIAQSPFCPYTQLSHTFTSFIPSVQMKGYYNNNVQQLSLGKFIVFINISKYHSIQWLEARMVAFM